MSNIYKFLFWFVIWTLFLLLMTILIFFVFAFYHWDINAPMIEFGEEISWQGLRVVVLIGMIMSIVCTAIWEGYEQKRMVIKEWSDFKKYMKKYYGEET